MEFQEKRGKGNDVDGVGALSDSFKASRVLFEENSQNSAEKVKEAEFKVV